METTTTITRTGRIMYSLGMCGHGILHFIFPGFRPVLIPIWPEWLPNPQWLVYLSGLALVVAGLFIVFEYKPRQTSVWLGFILLLLLLIFHIPFQLTQNPTQLGSWTNAFKILAMAGGAFLVAGSLKQEVAFKFFDKLIPAGRIFFAVMLTVFGIDHFLYVEFVKTLVPEWIPYPVFWTYFTGVALMGSGFSILFKIQMRLVCTLLTIMLFSWFLMLHIPRAVAPQSDNGNEITSVFQALAFTGIALVLAFGSAKQRA